MAGPDLSIVTAAVDFSTILPALLSVFGAVVVVYLTWKGAKMVLVAVAGGGGGSVSVGLNGYSESQYRKWWDEMDDGMKSFYGVSSYEDYRARYTAD